MGKKNNFLKAEPLQGFQGMEENIDPLTMSLCIHSAEWKIPALQITPKTQRSKCLDCSLLSGVQGEQSTQTVRRHVPFHVYRKVVRKE